MTERTASRLAWSLFAVAVAAMIAGQWLAILAHRASELWPFIPVFLAFAAVGALVASRRPSNAVGWLFVVYGAVGSLGQLSDAYARFGLRSTPHLPGTAWAAGLQVVGIDLTLPLLLLPILLFPDGHVPGRRWRAVPWIVGGVAEAAALTSALANVNFSNNFAGLRDPVQVLPLSAARQIYSTLQNLDGTVGLLLVGAAIIVRFRRSRGDERQQLKWFTYAVVVAMVGIVAVAIISPQPVVAFVVLAPFIPIAAGVAILKYRLYDIDVVINKTVVFGALAAFITAVYVAIVVGIGEAVGTHGKPNVGLSVLATAVVAFAFQPVRQRVRHLANRLVYGDRATPYEVVSGFAHRVAGALSVDEVLPRMAEATAKGLGAVRCRVRLLLPDGGERVEVWPDGADGDYERSVPVAHLGEPVGEIAVAKPPGEPMTPAEDRLLADLASQAGLALHNARLAAELSARLEEISSQAAELRASRQRIVTVQDAERRRLERQIHEGPQQQLLAMAVALRGAEQALDRDPTAATASLEALGGQANETLDGLRDLARGIFPPLLGDKGIVAALDAHVRKTGLPAEVAADPETASARFPADVESAVYFCCVEAVQNAARHAAGATVTVQIGSADGEVVFRVADRGPGFEPASVSRRSGLQMMADRVAALGGRFEVRSAPGEGTTVAGRIPVPALQPVG